VSLNPAAPRAPYGLEPTAFPLPAVAALAGRAPLGGPREIALACFLVGRMVTDLASTHPVLTADQRKVRAQGTRHWLGSATIPSPVRVALMRLVESTSAGDLAGTRTALDSVMTVTANHLDSAARLDLGRLAQTIVK
jgi:hypothetical protein